MTMRSARLALLVTVGIAVPAFAQVADRARTEALARRASERLEALEREADRLASQERTLLGDLRRLELDREIKAEQLRHARSEADAVASDLAANAERIRDLEQQDSAARPELRVRLVQMYKLGQARYLRLLLATGDVRQLARASRMVAAMAKLDRDRVASHERLLQQLRTARGGLEERSRQLEALRVEAERAQLAADRAAQARSDLVRDLDRRRDLNAQLSAELQQAAQKLQATLRDIGSGAGAAGPSALPIKPFRGDLDWPVDGPVLRPFARPGLRSPAGASGIEIGAAEGAQVSAVHDGVVAFADTFAGFGNLVIVDHGSRSFSLYGDLLDMSVSKGGRVERGQPVGTVGSSPAGSPRLYFELRVDGESVDPLQWLKKR